MFKSLTRTLTPAARRLFERAVDYVLEQRHQLRPAHEAAHAVLCKQQVEVQYTVYSRGGTRPGGGSRDMRLWVSLRGAVPLRCRSLQFVAAPADDSLVKRCYERQGT